MKSSKLAAPSNNNKPPWKPFSYGFQQSSVKKKTHNNTFFNDQPQPPESLTNPPKRQVNNNNSHLPHSLLVKQAQQQHFEESVKSRNLQVSKPLRNNFNSKTPRVIVPSQKLLSETHASYRVPGKERPIPIRHSGYKTIIDMSSKNDNNNTILYERGPGGVREEFRSMDSDAVTKIQNMKANILAGRHVSHTDIARLRVKLGVHHHDTFETPPEVDPFTIPNGIPQNTQQRSHHRKRMVVRKPIFCEKGIVHVPTPHRRHVDVNTFGTPADLRISLSNTDSPEFNRRRFYFDFTGFLDDDIKLYLEGSRRLVIRGDRPERSYEKPALRITDFIDLPKDLPVDNLRMVRDVFGTLIVEEAWKFL